MIILIVCMDAKGNIGREGRLPFDLPQEYIDWVRLQLCHNYGKNKPTRLLMGRKTWENRKEIFWYLSHNQLNHLSHVFSVFGNDEMNSRKTMKRLGMNSKHGAGMEEWIHDESKTFVLGGGEIFRKFVRVARKLCYCRLKEEVNVADTTFPYEEWRASLSHSTRILNRHIEERERISQLIMEEKMDNYQQTNGRQEPQTEPAPLPHSERAGDESGQPTNPAAPTPMG